MTEKYVPVTIQELRRAFSRGWECVSITTYEDLDREFRKLLTEWDMLKSPGHRTPGGEWKYPPDQDMLDAVLADRDDWRKRYLLLLQDKRDSIQEVSKGWDVIRVERELRKDAEAKVEEQIEMIHGLKRDLKEARRQATRRKHKYEDD